jgi:hypothetical protein
VSVDIRETSSMPAPSHDPADIYRTIVVQVSEVAGYNRALDQDPLYRPDSRAFSGNFKTLLLGSKSNTEKSRHEIPIRVRQSEYKMYFEKDKHGNYLPGVVEPPGGRAEWLRERIEERARLNGEDGSDDAANRVLFEIRSQQMGRAMGGMSGFAGV